MTRMFLQEERGGHKRHTQLTGQPRFQHPAQMLQEAARAEHPAFFHPHFSLPKAFLREANVHSALSSLQDSQAHCWLPSLWLQMLCFPGNLLPSALSSLPTQWHCGPAEFLVGSRLSPNHAQPWGSASSDLIFPRAPQVCRALPSGAEASLIKLLLKTLCPIPS